jgi:hypothetical protein
MNAAQSIVRVGSAKTMPIRASHGSQWAYQHISASKSHVMAPAQCLLPARRQACPECHSKAAALCMSPERHPPGPCSILMAHVFGTRKVCCSNPFKVTLDLPLLKPNLKGTTVAQPPEAQRDNSERKGQCSLISATELGPLVPAEQEGELRIQRQGFSC